MSSKPVDTAIVMVVGPCIDDVDFKSLEEAIAFNAAGMDISLIVEKTDGTTAVTAITLTTGGTSDWTHKDGGYYEVEITAAQNAEEGVGYVRGICDGVLPFESSHYDIVKANVYDSLIKGTDKLQIDLTQCGGSVVAAGAIPNAAADTAGGLPISDAGNLDIDTKLANTNEITAARMGALTDWINGGRLDNLLDAIPTTAMRGTDNATLAATWTDARAGYLDNLSVGAVALASGVDLTSIHGAALTETINGYLAAAFTKLFDVATPLLVASEVMRGTDGANTTVPDAAGVAPTAAEIKTAIEAAGSHLALILTDTNELQTDWVNGGRLDLLLDAIKLKTDELPSGMAKNVAVPKFDVFMVLSSDHVTAATGKTIVGTISKDGGAFALLANSITEVGYGVYTIADGLTQSERNADVSTLKFVADDCDARIITIISS